jgi:hypothetical protein
MTTLTLGQVTQAAGVGKSTIARAIEAGRLSATLREDGGYDCCASGWPTRNKIATARPGRGGAAPVDRAARTTEEG